MNKIITIIALSVALPWLSSGRPVYGIRLAQHQPPPAPPATHIEISELRPPPGPMAPPQHAWLGVGTEEVDEALAAQLNLKDGAGLVVTVVSKDSPAEKAGLRKNDVLVDLDDHVLVHPSQLRKIIQTRKEGDQVTIGYYRAGKKDTVKIELAKTDRLLLGPDAGPWNGNFPELNRELNLKFRQDMEHLKESLSELGLNRHKLETEIRRGLSEARKAMEEVLRSSTNASQRFSGPAAQILKDLSRHGLTVDDDTTVIIRKDHHNVHTLVKTDDEGTIILVATPKLFLTVRDTSGKVLFDAEIETEEQRQQIPDELKDRVLPVLEQFDKQRSTPPEPGEKPEPAKQSASDWPNYRTIVAI